MVGTVLSALVTLLMARECSSKYRLPGFTAQLHISLYTITLGKLLNFPISKSRGCYYRWGSEKSDVAPAAWAGYPQAFLSKAVKKS